MIYICKGLSAILTAPCTLCKLSCSFCDSACKALSKACGSCLDAISEAWAPIVRNPLSTFVLGTWALMAMIVSCTVWAGRRVAGECGDDAQRRQLMIFVALEITIAALHATFAFYIQRRLVARLEQGAPSGDISAATKHLLKYDIGFCFYVFFAIAACGYNSYSLTLLSCAGSAPILCAAWLMFTHAGFSLCYLCCFLCGHTASAYGTSATSSASAPRAGAVVVPGSVVAVPVDQAAGLDAKV